MEKQLLLETLSPVPHSVVLPENGASLLLFGDGLGLHVAPLLLLLAQPPLLLLVVLFPRQVLMSGEGAIQAYVGVELLKVHWDF